METRISQDRAGSRDVEEGFEQQYHSQTHTTTTPTTTTNPSKQRQRSSSSLSSLRAKLFTARSILGVLSMILAVAILGVVGYMVGRYGDQGFAHVSFVFVGITVRLFLSFFLHLPSLVYFSASLPRQGLGLSWPWWWCNSLALLVDQHPPVRLIASITPTLIFYLCPILTFEFLPSSP